MHPISKADKSFSFFTMHKNDASKEAHILNIAYIWPVNKEWDQNIQQWFFLFLQNRIGAVFCVFFEAFCDLEKLVNVIFDLLYNSDIEHHSFIFALVASVLFNFGKLNLNTALFINGVQSLRIDGTTIFNPLTCFLKKFAPLLFVKPIQLFANAKQILNFKWPKCLSQVYRDAKAPELFHADF